LDVQFGTQLCSLQTLGKLGEMCGRIRGKEDDLSCYCGKEWRCGILFGKICFQGPVREHSERSALLSGGLSVASGVNSSHVEEVFIRNSYCTQSRTIPGPKQVPLRVMKYDPIRIPIALVLRECRLLTDCRV